MPIDPRTGHYTDKSPDVEKLGFEWTELASLNAEAARLGAELTATSARLRELAEGRKQAERADQAAYAAAIRAGKAEPEQAKVDKLEAEIKAARQRQEALKVAVSEVEKDKTRVVNEHRGEWRSEVDERVPAVAETLEAAIRQVEESRAELAALRALQTWLAEPAKPYSPRDGAATVYMMENTTRKHTGSAPTLAELRAEAREVKSVH